MGSPRLRVRAGGAAGAGLHGGDAVDGGTQRAPPPLLRGGRLAHRRRGEGAGVERSAAEGAALHQASVNRGVGLVLLGVASAQVGAAFAVVLFDELGAAGAAFGRLGFAALILVAWWRPRVRGRKGLRTPVPFGLPL